MTVMMVKIMMMMMMMMVMVVMMTMMMVVTMRMCLEDKGRSQPNGSLSATTSVNLRGQDKNPLHYLHHIHHRWENS